MNLSRVYHDKGNRLEKYKYYDSTYIWNPKNNARKQNGSRFKVIDTKR